jgi:hypothetical protein
MEELEKEIGKRIIDGIKKFPMLVLIIAMAFISGHIWFFLISFVFNFKKGNKFLSSKLTKVCFGLLWFIFFMFPFCWFKSIKITDHEQIYSSAFGIALIAMFAQSIILMSSFALKRR